MDAADAAIAELKQALKQLYGDRFHRLVLFGSHARGNATSDSDIDVALVLRGVVEPYAELARTAEVCYIVELRRHVLFGLVPMSEADYLANEGALVSNIRREGVVA